MSSNPTIFRFSHIQIHSNEDNDDDETSYSTQRFRPFSAYRRNNVPSYPISPTTTSQSTHLVNFKGIPFSWERIPGIPKCQESNKKNIDSSRRLLPLPPAGNGVSAAAATKVFHNQEQDHRSPNVDPFLVALVKCSKDDPRLDHDATWKENSKKLITRSLSDRFGFISMYGSCKRTCAVSESGVYLPRSPTPHYLLSRRSSS